MHDIKKGLKKSVKVRVGAGKIQEILSVQNNS